VAIALAAVGVALTAIWFFIGFFLLFSAYQDNGRRLNDSDLLSLEYFPARTAQILLILACVAAFIVVWLKTKSLPNPNDKALFRMAAPLMTVGMYQAAGLIIDAVLVHYTFESATRLSFSEYTNIWAVVFVGMWMSIAVLQVQAINLASKAGISTLLPWAALISSAATLLVGFALFLKPTMDIAIPERDTFVVIRFALECLTPLLMALSLGPISKRINAGV
jgi:hypothetical protein